MSTARRKPTRCSTPATSSNAVASSTIIRTSSAIPAARSARSSIPPTPRTRSSPTWPSICCWSGSRARTLTRRS
ncbi:hypothetical protein FHY64_02860 [Pelagovum pacificum]|uniref:Uncharacterized protein n=1 Tax=Pelagovum pacificum TaxID=2588711 RepID=A0A5C5GJF5_9RHOB|nr:hypothetical protein I8N54_08735 [Pelagovum pacificum]TNY34294.1 hypothetical protein FHY64_02860 [Pelagovum pacificum]